MRRMLRPISVMCAALMATPMGCDFFREHKEAVTGAAIGAAAGGALGYVAGGHHHHRGGMAVGALLGGLAGAAIGESMAQRNRTAQEAAAATNYQPSQGVMLRVDGAATNPTVLNGGGQVVLSVSYTLLAPNQAAQMPVTETYVVTFNGNKLAEIPSNAQRAPGSYTSQLPITLQQGAAKGTYQVAVSVAAGGQMGQGATTFSVQ